jgi:hypothetical protein
MAIRDTILRNVRAAGETLFGTGLALVAQPLHEGGHAVAIRALTGVWPEIGFWAVHPTSHFATQTDALVALVAGDLAVLAWWLTIFLVVSHRPRWKWALAGPTLMSAIVLLAWFVSAVLTPFGRADLGASDAAKFLAISGLSPWIMALLIGGITAAGAALVARCFRSPSSTPRNESRRFAIHASVRSDNTTLYVACSDRGHGCSEAVAHQSAVRDGQAD